MKEAVTARKEVAADVATLADRLNAALAGRMTRAALAKRANVERQTVYYWFDGKTKSIDTPTLLRVANVLGVRAEWLQSGEGPMFQLPTLSDDEMQLVAFYRRIKDPTDQGVLMKMARSLAKDAGGAGDSGYPYPDHVPGR